MAESPAFALRVERSRVHATWRGVWSQRTASDYAIEFRGLMRGWTGNPDLVVDAAELDRCDILARGVLTDLHAQWHPRLHRTVFVASSANIRGVCLWIARVSGDEVARVLASERGVEAWLAASSTRRDDARARMKTGVAR